MQSEQNDEIDILSLLTTIWQSKWKVIFSIILTFIAGVAYTFSVPNSFQVSANINYDKQNIFVQFDTLNNILRESKYSFSGSNFFKNDKDAKIYQIDSKIIFAMFVTEFKDYKEMISVLSKNEDVINRLKNLNEYQKRKALINLANNFKMVKPKKKDLEWKIVFKWHDIDKGISLFEEALKLTLLNVKNDLFMDITSLASSLDSRNERRVSILKNKLDLIRKISDLSIAKQKLYLTEQSNIARALGIDKKILDFNGILKNSSISEKYDVLSPELEVDNFPYYLYGFRAIDKEIELIQKRSKQEKDLMANGYLEIKKELILIESDKTPTQLRNAAKLINEDDINKWINFNLEFAEVLNLKKSKLYILFSILLGLFTSIIFVVFSKALKERNKIEQS